jgi:small GTP-binding protein
MSVRKALIYKICVIGDGGVGKTSLVLRYTESKFNEQYIMTIGSNFAIKKVDLPEFPNLEVRLQLWDLAGQKHFSFVRPPFYRGAAGLIYVFDVTRRSSFVNLPSWKEEAEKVIGVKPSVILGNKIDLATDFREVGSGEGQALCDEYNASAYLETSAKTGVNYVEAFKKLVLTILKQFSFIP